MAAWRSLRATRSSNGLAAMFVLLLAIILNAAAVSATASAAELLMFEEAGCPWCIKWHKEVGPAYQRSPEGRRAPLRRLDIRAAVPAGVHLDKPVRATPTFVLIEQGREIGRITGYPGPDFFWGLLEEMMRKLPPFDKPKSAGMRAASLASPAWRSM
jgi:hypothetical protein